MTTEYKIYLVNNSGRVQTFWCFLEKPQSSLTEEVYANSSTSLRIGPNQGGTNSFTIPVLYQLGAGASNQAVGLDTRIDSSITNASNLQDVWLATYYNVSEEGKRAPEMSLVSGESSRPRTMQFQASEFNRLVNEKRGWYSNMSFGIQTKDGFIGSTWSPEPGSSTTITPKLTFYVGTGDYRSNELADFNTVSTKSAQVPLTKFDELGEATVTLNASGQWIVTPGGPSSHNAMLNSLIQSHLELSRSQSQLVKLIDDKENAYDSLALTPDYQRMMAIATGAKNQMLDPLTVIASVVGITVGIVELIDKIKGWFAENEPQVEVNIVVILEENKKSAAKSSKAELSFEYLKGVRNSKEADQLTSQALDFQIKKGNIKSFSLEAPALA